MSLSSSDRVLLSQVLKGVSRSFYLTLAVLPEAVRSQIGLAYLFARAADTIADTGELKDHVRLQGLQLLKQQFGKDIPEWRLIQRLQAQVVTKQSDPNERRLLEKLEQCFRIYQGFNHFDRSLIAQVVTILIGGMEFDIQRFPKGTGKGSIHALKNSHDFEYYTYAVAGCVGEFWTRMICTHVSGMRRWNQTIMIPLAIRFGKGLQMVNILRDLPKDLQNGRCYVPEDRLTTINLLPEQLFDQSSVPVFRPLFRQLLQEARDHLDQGWYYTMQIPRLEIRLRLACMWPLLIGIRTLQALSMTQHLLDPTYPIKVNRSEVYRIITATGLTGGSRLVGTAYWGYWRKRIV